MNLFAIDPGNTQSAYVEIDPNNQPIAFGIHPNHELLSIIRNTRCLRMAIECVASYGMPVGRTVFETAEWTGRFTQQWINSWAPDTIPAEPIRIYRQDVKLHICKSPRANDSTIRQALIDRYGPSKAEAIGVKNNPGPLYGFKRDLWAALAVAITANETQGEP